MNIYDIEEQIKYAAIASQLEKYPDLAGALAVLYQSALEEVPGHTTLDKMEESMLLASQILEE